MRSPFKADIINSDANKVGENTKEKGNKTIQKEMNLKAAVETTLTKELNIEAQTIKIHKTTKRRSKEERN